jgi:hypothetical protein
MVKKFMYGVFFEKPREFSSENGLVLSFENYL